MMVRRTGMRRCWGRWLVLGVLLCGRGPATRGVEPPTAKVQPDPAVGEVDRRRAEANRLNQEVVLLAGQGRYREATEIARRIVAIYKDVVGEQHPLYASALNNLAFLLREQGDLQGARLLHEQALAIRKWALGERNALYANSLNNLAQVLEAEGNDTAAEPLLRQSAAICKQVAEEGLANYALSLNNLASLYESKGDYARARPLYTRAIAILGDAHAELHPYYATILSNLGALVWREGDDSSARSYLEKSVAITRRTLGEHHPDYATGLHNLGMLLSDQGRYAAAKPLLLQALAIRKEALGEGHPDYAVSLIGVAKLRAAERDYEGARRSLDQAVVLRGRVFGDRHRVYADALGDMASLLELQGQFDAAKPLLEQILAIRKEALGERHPDYAAALANLAMLSYFQGDSGLAAPRLRQSLEITAANLELAASGQSERRQLALARKLRGDLDAYLLLAPLAHASVDSTYELVLKWKGAVLARQRRNRQLRRLARRDGDAEIARLSIALEGASRRLANLALSAPPPRDPTAWRRAVTELSTEQERLEEELAGRSAAYRDHSRKVAEGMSPDLLRACLPGDAALVDFLEFIRYLPRDPGSGVWRTERHLAAFVVRPGRPVDRVDLGPVEPIAKAITSWRATIGVDPIPQPPGSENQPDPATTLRARVWLPLEPRLEGAATVLISPDGVISRMPLGALPGRDPSRYLLEERGIAYVAVPQLLPELLGRKDERADPSPGADDLLLVGDVDFDAPSGSAQNAADSRSAAVLGTSWSFGPLPATRTEAAAIQRLFQRRFSKARVTTLDRGLATERAVREQAARHRWLHVATHGFFAPEGLRSILQGMDERPGASIAMGDPFGGPGVVGFHLGLLSGLVLAGANRQAGPGEDDGILTAHEVAELELGGVGLAVLSACETGLGESAGGEGLLGLQRAFQEAGARTVVASLWKIPDRSTQLLMARFYENLWEKKATMLEALREAQLWFLRGGDRAGVGTEPRGLSPLPDGPANRRPGRTSPRDWAAFVLSGDWR